MSNMCTCHNCPDSCEWCRLHKTKQIFSSLKLQHPAIKDVLWALHKLEDYMIANANEPRPRYEDWEGGSFAEVPVQGMSEDASLTLAEEPKFSAVCGSCKFFNSDTDICRKHNVYTGHGEPKCPDWRYFA